MNRYLSLMASISVFAATAAISQEVAYIQIEAQPTLNEAQFRAQAYAGALPQVNGFSLGSGWYAITLGPFAPDQAEAIELPCLFLETTDEEHLLIEFEHLLVSCIVTRRLFIGILQTVKNKLLRHSLGSRRF